MRISHTALIAVAILSALLATSMTRLLDNHASAARLQDSESPSGEIAYCALMEISEELMNSDRFRPARETEEARLTESLADLRAQITEISGVLRGADREDPDLADERQQIQQLMNEFQQRQGVAQRQMEQFIVGQFVEAYEMARSSARAVAEEKGYEYLLASGSPEKELPTDRPMDTLRNEMFQRPVLMGPEGTDISDDVRADLNLF